MGGRLPLIALFVVAVIGQHVVSATDCRESNCQFDIREECQNSQTVFCSMKDRPLKQINITATSFPRDVIGIKLSDAESITIEADAIASLTSLRFIQIINVSKLILRPRSLALGNEFDLLVVSMHKIRTLQIYSEAFAGWKGDPEIFITEVDNCQMLQSSVGSTHARSLTLKKISSLVVHEQAFSADSGLENFLVSNVTSLSIKKEAFASNVTVSKTWVEDIESLSFYSGALSQNSKMHKVSLEGIKHLIVDPNGIEADIDELKIREVAMETCSENAFGDNIGSLSLTSSHIHRARRHCISAGIKMSKLIVENNRFYRIETSAIYGTVPEAQIQSSKIKTIAKGGVQLNVTKFSIENSTIGEVSEEAFVVLADNNITIRDCTIDVVQKGAFSSLSVTQGNGTAHHQIQLDSIHIKLPQNGSLRFDQNQRVIVHDLTLDINCACDIATALGLDVSSENESWINQTSCEINNTRSKLGSFLKEFCTEPTTIVPSKTSNEVNVMKCQDCHDSQTTPETRDQTPGDSSDQTSGDGSDQDRTGSTHNMGMEIGITTAVLISVVVTFLILRLFKPQWHLSVMRSLTSTYALVFQRSDQQTHRPDPCPESSASTQVSDAESGDMLHQVPDQGVPGSPTSSQHDFMTPNTTASHDELSQPPDERYKLLASYRSDQPKDPRIQQLARDRQHATRPKKETWV